MIEVLINDKFVDPTGLDTATRKQVSDYLVTHFLEMSRQDLPNEIKLTALSKYLHKYFPEVFEL
ncbi:hypothetical protein OAQ05_01375 [Acidimicrobiia bacterium]|nr:hypothetical protein [Acidimicrobiia bacterium]